MKRLMSMLAVCATLVLFAVGGWSKSAPQPAFQHLVSVDSASTTFDAESYDGIFLFATWCPYSDEFARILSILQRTGQLRGMRIAVLVADEWTRFETYLRDENGMSDDQLFSLKGQLTEQARYSTILVDQDKLESYPGEVFVYPGPADDLNFASGGFPAGFSQSSNAFDDHAIGVLLGLGISEELLVELYDMIRSEAS